jgi:uncharacterized protein YjiS (DUF1127 family)
MNLLKQIGHVWIQHREFQAALASLKRLSDRELSDLGLARGDIARAAFEEAERRAAAFARSGPEPRPAGGGEAGAQRGTGAGRALPNAAAFIRGELPC